MTRISLGKTWLDSSGKYWAGLARGQLGERWLWSQLQILAEEAQQQEPQSSFDPQATWRALAAEDNIHELLYLLRVFWTSQTITTA